MKARVGAIFSIAIVDPRRTDASRNGSRPAPPVGKSWRSEFGPCWFSEGWAQSSRWPTVRPPLGPGRGDGASPTRQNGYRRKTKDVESAPPRGAPSVYTDSTLSGRGIFGRTAAEMRLLISRGPVVDPGGDRAASSGERFGRRPRSEADRTAHGPTELRRISCIEENSSGKFERHVVAEHHRGANGIGETLNRARQSWCSQMEYRFRSAERPWPDG